MASQRKIEASRANGRKSRGPRSAAGKAIASRNATSHGLRALMDRPPVSSPELNQLVTAICGDDNDPELVQHARVIANNELILQTIRAHQNGVIERLRDRTNIALEKGDNSLEIAKAKSLELRAAEREIEAAVPKLLEKYEDQLPFPPGILAGPPGSEEEQGYDELVPICLKAMLQENETEEDEQRAPVEARQAIEHRQRDEAAAFKAAMPDLVRLEGYERRVCSRQRRAIREFVRLKLLSHPKHH